MTELGVVAYGAGGGGGGKSSRGGAGAFVYGRLAVIPGETLRIIVGRAGRFNDTAPGTDAQGGGGVGVPPPHTILQPIYHGSSGGGRTAIHRMVGGSYVEIVTAGGGGGGGGYLASGGAAGVLAGHRGGDQVVTTRFAVSPVAAKLHLTSTWGGGGSQSAPGAGSYDSYGSQFAGGSTYICVRDQCGGGGSGFYGGGAGDDVSARAKSASK